MFNIKFTPEAFFMLPLAIGLDLIGVILLCVGGDDLGMVDAIGIVFINGWLLLRGKKNTNTQGKGGMNNIKKVFTGKTTKFVVPTFGELIPYIGSLPFWTLTVFFNLTEE